MPTLADLFVIAPLLASIQQMLATTVPKFIQVGLDLWLPIAGILLSAYGIRTVYYRDGGWEWGLVKLIAWLAGARMMLTLYTVPIPGAGTSFSGLVSSFSMSLVNVLDVKAADSMSSHLDILLAKFLVPSAFDVLSGFLYGFLVLGMGVAKGLMLAVIGWGFISTAVITLMLPLVIPFVLVPRLDWLFWGMIRALISHGMIAPVCFAYLLVFERYAFAFSTTMPAVVSPANFIQYLVAVLGVLIAFATGLWFIPSLTASMFGGGGATGGGAIAGAVAAVFRK